MILEYKIKKKEAFENVLEVLKTKFEISKRLLVKLKNNKAIYLNNQIATVKDKVKVNDVVKIIYNEEENSENIVKTKGNFNILYEDEYMLIINKPSGIVIHPSIAHYKDSLSNFVNYYYDKNNIKAKIRPVNRLDGNTSGIVIFAKNSYIQEMLVKQMKTKEFKKSYIVICEGKFEKKQGIIDSKIARESNSIIKRCISEFGKTAITKYKVLKYNKKKDYSVVKCDLLTGRTHQIRVHLSSLNHPIIGDDLYGSKIKLENKHYLKAYKVVFIHPISKKKMVIKISKKDNVKF